MGAGSRADGGSTWPSVGVENGANLNSCDWALLCSLARLTGSNRKGAEPGGGGCECGPEQANCSLEAGAHVSLRFAVCHRPDCC